MKSCMGLEVMKVFGRTPSKIPPWGEGPVVVEVAALVVIVTVDSKVVVAVVVKEAMAGSDLGCQPTTTGRLCQG